MGFVFNDKETISNPYLMDLKIENKQYIIRDDIHSLLLSTLFTNTRVGGKGGHYLPVESSGIWAYENDKRDEVALFNIQEEARLALSRLKSKGYFESFRLESSLEGDDIVIKIFIKKNNYEGTQEYSFRL